MTYSWPAPVTRTQYTCLNSRVRTYPDLQQSENAIHDKLISNYSLSFQITSLKYRSSNAASESIASVPPKPRGILGGIFNLVYNNATYIPSVVESVYSSERAFAIARLPSETQHKVAFVTS